MKNPIENAKGFSIGFFNFLCLQKEVKIVL